MSSGRNKTVMGTGKYPVTERWYRACYAPMEMTIDTTAVLDTDGFSTDDAREAAAIMLMVVREADPGFNLLIKGELYPISRDVCTEHPTEVHDAMGTNSETDLQHAMDALNYSMFFDANGEYLGRDENGLEIAGL